MQASTFGVEEATFGVQSRRGLVGFREFRNGSVLRPRRVCMANNNIDLCGLRLGSVTMETELTNARVGFGGIFGPSVKPRSVRVMASDGKIEDVVPATPQGKSSGDVLPYVGVACLGAILFGYHLGVVNGALNTLLRILQSLKILFYKAGLSAHYLLVPLLVHLLVDHWLTNLEELGLFN
ncbi:hypothetical protein GLYMA_19G050202v4 [Glycine max]|nr:hypothetical protein GLYMA_19G050202v4 [Glycine max]